jgi:predicted RNA-binding Zn ribbon-like protein
MNDPRPHIGEPLAVDLLNTRWNYDGPHDLLSDVDGLRSWLESNGLTDRARADEAMRTATVAARDAIHAAITSGTNEALNAVLEHGRVRRELAADGPNQVVEVLQPEWLPGWLAAENLLDLLTQGPDRIRQCAGHACVLYFYDTSKSGKRRWHSMAACGNREKAARNYARRTVRESDPSKG